MNELEGQSAATVHPGLLARLETLAASGAPPFCAIPDGGGLVLLVDAVGRVVTEPGELLFEESADRVVDRLNHFAAATLKAASKP